MALIKWKRPNGRIIETNDTKASIDYAESNKWERVKKRGRKPKAEAQDDGGNSERHNQERASGDSSPSE